MQARDVPMGTSSVPGVLRTALILDRKGVTNAPFAESCYASHRLHYEK